MTTLHIVYHLARADFLERTRRYSFLVTLGLIVLLAYSYVPSRDAGYITLSVDGARGLYNSAWTGSLVAILTGMTMPLLGFYFVKNAVERDKQTGVGQVMATTPLTRPAYTLGKWLSNFAVLALMIAVIALATGILQLALGEDHRLDIATLLAPIVWVVLPTMALVSAVAVLFETIGWLRGGLGNIVYFFLCTAITMASFMPVMMSEGGRIISTPPVDVFGIGLPLSSMLRATSAAFPGLDFGNNSIGPIPSFLAGQLQTFVWAGVQWSPSVIGARLVWVCVAFAISVLAALFFNRFDPARERRHRTVVRRSSNPVADSGVFNRRTADERRTTKEAEPVETTVLHPLPVASARQSMIRLTPLDSATMRFSFGRMFIAELRLLGKGLRWWWYLVAAGLIIAAVLLPTGIARQYLLPAAWLWPVLAWSALGTREARHHTEGMVFSAARPLARQLPASWLAGVFLTALTGSGVALNLLRAGDFASLYAWAAAVLFIPSLALALGVWSGSGKLFEVVYLVLWYLGPTNQLVPQLDYMGTTEEAITSGLPLIYLMTAATLLGVMVIGRQRQIQR